MVTHREQSTGQGNDIDIKSFIRRREGRAEFMSEGFHDLFRLSGFDSSLVQKHGAFCCDVEGGPEIIAVNHFKPQKIIASEPKMIFTSYRSEEKVSQLLSTFDEQENCKILRLSSLEAIQQLVHEGQQFGLVTRLNAFPEFLTENVRSFLNGVKPLLAPNGLCMITATEPGFREFFQGFEQTSIEGYRLMSYSEKDIEFHSIGNVGILATRTEE